jgi:putative ABC transport system substrate-binding protein
MKRTSLPLRRREFITLLGGAAAWPLAASAQQGERMRRVGVLMATTADDPESQTRIAALQQGLQEAGWAVGRNVRIDTRWSGGDVARLRSAAAELIAVGSDVIVAGVGPTLPILQEATRTVPVVMAQGLDPVGAGFVQSLSRPGGNMTGFTQFEYSLSGKWLELLKEVAPQVSRVGVVRELRGGPVGIGQWAVIAAFASPMGVELSPINLHALAETERAVSAFAGGPNDGLIVVVGSLATIQRELIIALAARHRLPAVYPYRFFAESGGLISYGPNLVDLYRRAAAYVDRILRGEKPADLPVQAPNKYELVINLKTAKALGLEIPPSLLARADEVIE